MPTVRERKSSKNDDGETACDGDACDMEVIDVSDYEANEGDPQTSHVEVDLTEAGDGQDHSGTNHPPESSEKENAFLGDEDKDQEEEMDLMLPKANEGRTRNDTDVDEQAEDDADADSNNSDEGTGIAMTRAKRNSVRRPTRPGDFEFDYGDSTDFDEDEDGERARPTRALLERQRNLRASDGGLTEESGEGERVRRGEMTGRSAGRKRTSGATENAASQKRRRRNQTTNEESEDVEEVDPTFNSAHHSNNNSNSNSSSSNSNNGGSNGRSRGAADGKASATPSNNSDDSDLFCWVCHRYGKVICCETCVRVYHMRCLNLTSEPSDDWFCPECADSLLDSQPTLNFLHEESRRAILTHEELVPLLLHVTKKMFEVPASEPFHEPVDTSDVRDYENYIINPMSISTLQENVKALKYSSVGSFMSDARWIVHNCIVYNGHANPLTAVSRQILKRCRMELREITACPDCYRYQVEAEKAIFDDGVHWFSKLCRIPHPIVWVRLRNYPEWPAKVIEEVRHRDEYRVRTKFFGAHDYAEVPYSCVTFHTPIKAAVDPKTLQVEHFKEALDELQTHQRLLKEKYPDFVLPSVAVNYVPEIADNAYRRLGSRQTRVVCATLGGDGSGTVGGENSGVVGDVVAVPGSGSSALLSSRRSSSESVSSSVFASGTNVHMYRAKPISDTKTRLVSVAMDTTGPAPAPPPAEVKRQDSTGASTEAVNGAEPMDATADAVVPPAEVSEAVESVEQAAASSAVEISSSGEVTEGAQVDETPAEGPAEGLNEPCLSVSSREAAPPPVAETEPQVEIEPEVEVEPEAPAPPSVQHQSDCADRATSTEDLEDIFSTLRSSSVNSLLQLPLIELLSGLRWSGLSTAPGVPASPHSSPGATRGVRSGGDSGDRLVAADEALARKEAECERLSRENGELRKAMDALERLRREADSKLSQDVPLTEERLGALHELRLLEMRHNYELCLAEVRHAHENDKQKIVTEVRRLLTEDVRKIVGEVKRKQWCAYCRNEAFYYCCWNTSYCDANCQKKHWTTHMSTCAQTNPSLSDGVARRGVAAVNQVAANNNSNNNNNNNNTNSNSIGGGGPNLGAPHGLANRRMLNPNNMATLPQR